MDDALQRALERAVRPEVSSGELDATLRRAREQVAALAATTAELEASLPTRISEAVHDGIRDEVLPVARHIAEVRGLMNHLVRRVEGLETELLAERHARIDDLAVLVDLIAAGFKSSDARFDRLEKKLGGDVVQFPIAS
jgi:hypothetical protein